MKYVILLLPVLLGFVKPTAQVKEYFQEENWPALRSHLIAIAQSEKQLDSNLAEFDVIVRDHEVCQQQLKLRTFPLKCFDVLKREKDLGILKAAHSKGMQEFLDKMCEETVLDILELKDMRFSGLKKKTLSPKCRTLLSERLEILRYKAFETDPKGVFDFRWK